MMMMNHWWWIIDDDKQWLCSRPLLERSTARYFTQAAKRELMNWIQAKKAIDLHLASICDEYDRDCSCKSNDKSGSWLGQKDTWKGLPFMLKVKIHIRMDCKTHNTRECGQLAKFNKQTGKWLKSKVQLGFEKTNTLTPVSCQASRDLIGIRVSL